MIYQEIERRAYEQASQFQWNVACEVAYHLKSSASEDCILSTVQEKDHICVILLNEESGRLHMESFSIEQWIEKLIENYMNEESRRIANSRSLQDYIDRKLLAYKVDGDEIIFSVQWSWIEASGQQVDFTSTEKITFF